MESSSWNFVFVAFGFAISVCALAAESPSQEVETLNVSTPRVGHPPPPSTPPSPPSPPQTSSSPPSPPPPSPLPPPPPQFLPSPPPTPPRRRPPSPSHPPPSPRSPQQKLNSQSNRSPHRKSGNLHESKKHPPPPPEQKKINTGKKIGLLFAGIAAILQIGVVGFLVFKRRQLLNVKNRYETCS